VLAQLKSSKKSVRTDEKSRMKNRSWKSRIKTARRKLEAALEGQGGENLDTLFRDYTSVIDRAVTKGVVHRNNASRKKTRMAHKLKYSVVPEKQPTAKPSDETEKEASEASE
jgi:small subunit ribosomal protein S20